MGSPADHRPAQLRSPLTPGTGVGSRDQFAKLLRNAAHQNRLAATGVSVSARDATINHIFKFVPSETIGNPALYRFDKPQIPSKACQPVSVFQLVAGGDLLGGADVRPVSTELAAHM